MALTADGRALTIADGRRQASIAARAMGFASLLWAGLDIDDLDGSTPAWLAANTAVAADHYAQSARATAGYVAEYRAAELAPRLSRDLSPATRPPFAAAATAHALQLAGPVRVKMLVGSGMPPDEAADGAKTKFLGMMSRQVLMGGRRTIDATTRRDPQAIGWRRVTSGAKTCAFCAMLASRGPVYGSYASGGGAPGEGLEYHGGCQCHAEIVYGEWKPNQDEQRFIDAYEQAAKQADEAGQKRVAPVFARGDDRDNILWRMRRNNDWLSDAVKSAA